MDNILFVKLKDLENLDDQLVAWVLTSKKGTITEVSSEPEKLKKVIGKHKKSAEISILIPENIVSYHLVNLPIKDRKKRAQAVKYILEDKLLTDIEDTHFSIGPKINNNNYIVATVSRDSIIQLLNYFNEYFSIKPKYILTESICLYEPEIISKNQCNLYLNAEDNLSIMINENVITAEIDNMDLVLSNIGKDINCNLYKYKLDDLNKVLPSSLKKLNINSEQLVENWLALVVSSWFKNNNFTNKFNIASGLVKTDSFSMSFNYLWQHTAMVLIGCLLLIIPYKYIDNKLFSNRALELKRFLQVEMEPFELKNNNLELIDNQIKQKSNILKKKIEDEIKKDQFFILLQEFSNYYKSGLLLNKILYQEGKLTLTIVLDKINKSILSDIKSKLAKAKISIAETIINDDKELIIEWQLTGNTNGSET